MRSGVSWAVVIVSAALVGLLAYGLTSTGSDASIDQALSEGKRPPAPQQELPTLGTGTGTASLADFRGQVVVLNVWASWCPPCVKELPLLERTHQRLRKDNALVLGINRQDFSENGLATARKFDLSFISLRDPDARFTGEQLRVSKVPETFVIDRQGRIAAHSPGEIDQAWLDKTLPPLLAEKA